MSETPILRHADAKEGFDRSEPDVLSIWGFTIGSVLVLAIMIGALSGYFFKIWNDEEQERVLSAPDPKLQTVRARDDWDLTHYMYLDKKTGQIRIPVDRAEELFLNESSSGKVFYPGKPTAPKKEEPAAATPAAGAPGAPVEPAGDAKKK
jgi:hypothetical protein